MDSYVDSGKQNFDVPPRLNAVRLTEHPLAAWWPPHVCPMASLSGPHPTVPRRRASPTRLVGSTSLAHFASSLRRARTYHRFSRLTALSISPPASRGSGASSPSLLAHLTTHAAAHSVPSPPARQAGRPALPLHFFLFPRRAPSAFPIQPSTAIAGTAGAIKKVKLNNYHRIAASSASQPPPSGGGAKEGRQAAKGSIKRRGGDEACRPTPSNVLQPPSPPMPASRS